MGVYWKKRYMNLIIDDMNSGERVLKKLNTLSIPAVAALGNVDWPEADDVADSDFLSARKSREKWKFELDRDNYFANLIKKYKNVHLINYSYWKFKDYILIGARGHTFPGNPKSRAYKKHKKILLGLFKKFQRENKAGKVIFVSHNVPYRTKLDKIGIKAHKLVRGKHYGSKLIKEIILKCKPRLHIGGHIHEGRGVQKIGRTLLVNPGSAHEGKGAIVEIRGTDAKVRVKLIK